MKLSNDRIGLKLVRPSEFKWTGTHSTQVHMPENYIKDWKKETTLDGKLAIIPSIQGWAKVFGYNNIIIDDEDDPYAHGFQVI